MASSNLAVINEQSKATPDNTRGWLTQRSKTMEALVPHGTGVKIDRMIVQATALCANNPTLAACTVRSIQLAVFKAAELGLELLPELAQAYIVPRSGQRRCGDHDADAARDPVQILQGRGTDGQRLSVPRQHQPRRQPGSHW